VPIKGQPLALLTGLDAVDRGVLFSVVSALLDLRTDDTARQISISFPLIGNGHFIWLLVIFLFLLRILVCFSYLCRFL
jgi:hypothetical protein